MNEFSPYSPDNGCFIVRNICPDRNKTIKIFNYPILYNTTRDLLKIEGIDESDIRGSLLKGELLVKILSKEIIIECSDIDLLQFNNAQKVFLQNAGIINGLQISSSNLDVLRMEDVQLLGNVDGVNTIFTIPSGKFIQNSIYKIIVYLNGVKQFQGGSESDYMIAESGGTGTGYDTVIFVQAPNNPSVADIVTADYYVTN